MSDKNENGGFPKGFEGNLIQQSFPEGRPIFWGPNQSTRYPDTYNEPKDWKQLELLKIPQIIRFITGGDLVPQPLYVDRTIYLGFTNTSPATIYYLSESPVWGYQDPFEKYGTAGGSFSFYKVFQEVNEIADDYDANMSTHELMNLCAYTQEHVVSGGLITPGKIYAGGPVHGNYQYTLGPFGARLVPGSQYMPNSGGLTTPFGIIPVGFPTPYNYGTMDTQGLVTGDADWKGDTVGFVQNANKIWQYRESSDTIYWFIHNKIQGNIENQTNKLFAVGAFPGQSPGSTYWNDIIAILNLYISRNQSNVPIPDLILQVE